ncbi:MAG: VCBS repeat-containing protein [Xanthobacteraceae bacterium]
MFTLGMVPFAATSEWNTEITAGSTYTSLAWPASTGYNYSVAWSSYSPSVYVASSSDPLVTVSYPAGWGYPGGSIKIHMPAAADGAAGTDGELLVIDGDIVYNFWQFDRTSLTTGTAASFGQENIVTGDGWGSKSPFLSAGITAIGASQLGGLLVKAETDTGVINHALQLTVDFKLAQPGFTGDAIAGDGSSSTGIVQEGDHLAIAPGTPMPSGLSPLGQEVFVALQKYGAYVVDVSGGTTNLRAQANAYDDATMTALWKDMGKITPLLQEVNVAPSTALPARNDFNGDGRTDLLWVNSSTGKVVQWDMNDRGVLSSASIGGDTNWSVVGTGDFNGDGKSDILWRYNPTGLVVEWDMNDRTVLSSGAIGGDSNWSVVGTGDFNGDGRTDILWRQNTTGTVIEWDMNDRTVLSSGGIGGDTNWSVVGTGDFNGDGKTDILWRNNTNGSVVEWDMNDRTVLSSGVIGGDTNWSVVGTGDFNGDGKTDILWRSNANGAVIEWDMNDRTVLSSGVIGGDTNWSVAGVGDFNGDGRSDILWRYAPTGAIVEWDMQDRTVLSTGSIGGTTSLRPIAV